MRSLSLSDATVTSLETEQEPQPCRPTSPPATGKLDGAGLSHPHCQHMLSATLLHTQSQLRRTRRAQIVSLWGQLHRGRSHITTQGRSNVLTRRPPPSQKPQIPTYLWITAGGTLLVVGGTYFAFLDRVPLTRRQRWIATNLKMEQELGDLEYQKMLQQFRGKILPPHHRANRTVQRVGSRLASAANEFMERHGRATQAPSRDMSLLARPYTFTVIQSDMANAFCLPGNHVFVMTGLFRFVRTEDELAAVMGHESTCPCALTKPSTMDSAPHLTRLVCIPPFSQSLTI